MARVAVAAAVVIALAAGVWLLWPEDEPAPITTLPVAGSSTTVSPTTSSPSSTTSTTEDGRLVETVEEAEAILRDLWFGWFEGIYDQDEDRIREVVYSEELVETASAQFATAEFQQRPDPNDIGFSDTELLRSDSTCLVVWTQVQLTRFREGTSQGVHVLRWREDHWTRHTLWRHQDDLWQSDCN